MCAPHRTPTQHRKRPATPRPGTTAHERRAALRASQRHAVRPQAGRAPGAIVPVPDRCPSKDPGRRGILWPPLYTVKWTREHIPIVFFTERHHSDRSALGLTGSYETGRIDQAEVREEVAHSILVRWFGFCAGPARDSDHPSFLFQGEANDAERPGLHPGPKLRAAAQGSLRLCWCCACLRVPARASLRTDEGCGPPHRS